MRAPDGSIYRENVGLTYVDGTPLSRELSALNDLDSVGAHTIFMPYTR
jgi:hypothetical protein